jgi:hypothetical protein
MTLQSFVRSWRFFSFLILYTVGRAHWTRDQPVARPLPTHRTTETQHKCTQTSMLEWNSKPRSQRSNKRGNTVHALDLAATVIGKCTHTWMKFRIPRCKWCYVEAVHTPEWIAHFQTCNAMPFSAIRLHIFYLPLPTRSNLCNWS